MSPPREGPGTHEAPGFESILPGLEPIPLFPSGRPPLATRVVWGQVGPDVTGDDDGITEPDRLEVASRAPERAPAPVEPPPLRSPPSLRSPPPVPVRAPDVAPRASSAPEPVRAPAVKERPASSVAPSPPPAPRISESARRSSHPPRRSKSPIEIRAPRRRRHPGAGAIAVVRACLGGIRRLFVRTFLGPLGHLYISGDLTGPTAWKTVRELDKKRKRSVVR